MQRLLLIVGILFSSLHAWGESVLNSSFSLDEIILDIFNAATEINEVEFDQLQTDLYALHDSPIDLNNTSDEELSQLYFLSPQQIDDILAYADKHPFESLYELRMIGSLADYEIRDLLPFVTIRHDPNTASGALFAKEVFADAKHEMTARVDARNIEDTKAADPIFAQMRYRFDYRRRVIFGGQLRRPVAAKPGDLQYGVYLQLTDIGHLHRLVAGNFQASFGQGLVLAPVFHAGKSVYVQSVGQQTQGLRYYSSADGEGLHGAGATFRWNIKNQTRMDVSALYSMKHANDSIWQHTLGANITVRHKCLEVQATVIENIWSDSIHPYNNAKYNRHYFRGYNQAVIGASARYHRGWVDVFAEAAAAQNREQWGVGVLAGSRFYPTQGVSLVALYRYYSPWFDNQWGYGFSETSRIGDENGGYLGFDITRLRNWRFSGYGDVFYFKGVKYGIPDTCTIGYDVLAEAAYTKITDDNRWDAKWRIRARKKGSNTCYSTRLQFDWSNDRWSVRTTVDANLTGKKEVSVTGFGASIAQDVAYSFSSVPLTLRLRLQAFDVKDWNNRIYLYEYDVLYSFSNPATYGVGGRAYLCLRWQIIRPLALYLRVSETIYNPSWAEAHSKSMTRTDVHLLLRATF